MDAGRRREEGEECGRGVAEGQEVLSPAELSDDGEGQGAGESPKSKPGQEVPRRLSVVTPAGHSGRSLQGTAKPELPPGPRVEDSLPFQGLLMGRQESH